MQSSRPLFSSWPPLSFLATVCCLAAWPVFGQSDQCVSALGKVHVVDGQQLRSELEILSWNIQKASNNGWADDLANISPGVDLAFIQEASVQARISQVFPEVLHQVFAAGYTTEDLETGVMTLSAISPSGYCTLTAWEPWLGTPKATSISEYALLDRDDRLLTINLHAVNFTFGVENLQGQLQALSNVLGNHTGPVILAGDLNTWSDQRQLVVDGFMQEHGLGPVIFEPDLRTTAFGNALDHIYVRGMRAEYAQVLPVTSSDHNPLRVRLAIQ